MTKKSKEIQPPENLYRVEVHTDWRYGKHAKFWSIEKFDEERSKKYEQIVYSTACRGGLAYTNFGLWLAVRRKMKKMKVGYSTNYFTLDGKLIEKT